MFDKLPGFLACLALATSGFAQVDAPDPELKTTFVGEVEVVAGEVLVQFDEDFDSRLWAGIHELVGGGVFENVTESLHRVKLPQGMQIEEAIAQYESFGEVDFAEPNFIYYTSETPNDPGWGQQWGPRKIDVDHAWDTFKGDRNYTVAVLDTGVDIDHVDLADDQVYGYDFYNGDPNPNDSYGHGTHCAGIAAAETNNGIGIAGVARDCTHAGYRIGPGPSLSTSAAVNAINDARIRGFHVISMSWGGSGQSSSLNNALGAAWNAGIVNVAAAGNNGNTQLHYPAAYSSVIAVASSNSNDSRSSFSTYGNWVDVAAPGSSIYATWNNGGYTSISGTSMACPHVAGQATLLYAYLGGTRSNANAVLIRNAIQDSSVPVNYVQHGRVDVDDSLLALQPPGPPIVNSITPPSTSSCGGETITLSGTDLAGTTSVTLGGSSIPFNVVDNTQVTFVAPFHPVNLNSDPVVLTTAQGSDSSQSLGYFAQDEPDIKGSTFIFKPNGGDWTECGGVQSDGNGRLYVEFLGTGNGSTPIGNGLAVPVANGQLFTFFGLDQAGTHQSTLPGYNGPFTGSIYFGMATFDLLQGKFTDVRPTPFKLTVF